MPTLNGKELAEFAIKNLTREQCLELTAITGILCCNNFADYHAEVQKKLDEPVLTHFLFQSPQNT